MVMEILAVLVTTVAFALVCDWPTDECNSSGLNI